MATDQKSSSNAGARHCSWLSAGIPATKAVEGLAAAARACGDTAHSAAIASIASSLKCIICTAKTLHDSSCDDPEWRARRETANGVLHARYLAGKADEPCRASDVAPSETVALRNLA